MQIRLKSLDILSMESVCKNKSLWGQQKDEPWLLEAEEPTDAKKILELLHRKNYPLFLDSLNRHLLINDMR